MGAWGASLYQDDTTCDVREDYVMHLKHGKSDDEACDLILQEYGECLEEHSIRCLVYFALADTAWKYGRLGEEVKDHALSLLAAGGDLSAWETQATPADAKVRRKALRALETQLLSPQPGRKPVKISPPKSPRFLIKAPLGSVFLQALPSGGYAIFVLEGLVNTASRHAAKFAPAFSVLRRRVTGILSEAELAAARAISACSFESGLGSCPYLGVSEPDTIRALLPTGILTPPGEFDMTRAVFKGPLIHVLREVEAQLE